MAAKLNHTIDDRYCDGYGRCSRKSVWNCFFTKVVKKSFCSIPLFAMTNRKESPSTKWSPKHFYFEKYRVLDGEGQYPLMAVRATTEPLSYETWMREFLGFSWATNNEKPWNKTRTEHFLSDDDPQLEVYGGIRIYDRFLLSEISRDDYEVLLKYLLI